VNTQPLFSHRFSWVFSRGIIILISLTLVVMILNSNFQMGLIREKLLSISNKTLIFTAYVIIYVLTGVILLSYTNRNTHQKNITGTNKRVYSISIFLVFLILTGILIATMIQMYFLNSYNSLVFYLISYISFISSLAFLLILSFKFFKWFSVRKNYVTLSYGILFSLFCSSVLIASSYLKDGLATHPSVIVFVSPRVLNAGTYSINNVLQSDLATTYDVLFFTSFILAWILSVVILKQYIHRIGKFKFWLLVSLPLIFYMIRYEVVFNVFNQYTFNAAGTSIIPSSMEQAFFITLINSDIQMTGIFFGFPFLIIAMKLNNQQLRRSMIVTVIGMMLLFGSRDLHSIFVSSYPPGGIVTIALMPIASYMLFIGLLSFLRLAVRDKQLYADLTKKIETDYSSLKNLILSEKSDMTLKMAKPLVDFSIQWQKSHNYEELSIQEVREIIDDIRIELKKKAK
jgi:hypothetical protein